MNSENMNEIFGALAKAQEDIEIAEKNVDNNFLKSKYADLVGMIKASRPALSKNGLCVTQQIIDEDGKSFLYTKLGHSSGQWIGSKSEIHTKTIDKVNPNQAFGSSCTYLRKYAYSAITGVGAGSREDDDAESAAPKGVDHRRPPVKNNAAPAELINAKEVLEIEALLGGNIELLHDALLTGKINELKDLQKSRLAGFMAWIEREKEKRKTDEVEDFIL
jgi:hypothetical protein